MGPCAPSEPVLHSSGFADASEHAAISGCVETRVECTVSHGLGKSGGNDTIRTFPVHLGTQFAQVGYLGVESVPVISGFYAESSAVVQDKSYVDRAVSHGFDAAMSGGSCGKGTSRAHLARSQPGVGTQYAHVGYPGVDFAVEAVVPGFPAESSAVSHGFGRSGGNGTIRTFPVHLGTQVCTSWSSRS